MTIPPLTQPEVQRICSEAGNHLPADVLPIFWRFVTSRERMILRIIELEREKVERELKGKTAIQE